MKSFKHLRRFIQKKVKILNYYLFTLLHGVISKTVKISALKDANITKCIIDNLNYNIYSIRKVRLYTNRVHDMSVIKDNVLVEGPSYQLRNLNLKKTNAMDNAAIVENDALKYGTPRIKKNINGTVLSMLSGGAANLNYFHWLYDVLPRLGLCEKVNILNKIDFFLFPNLDLQFQKETLELLNLNSKKCLNSKKFRHIHCENLFVTDHPFVIDNADVDIHNIPLWIIKWLKVKFGKFSKKNAGLPKKIFIDRSDMNKDYSKYSREIINENEIKEFLDSKGFSFIQLSQLSFEDQINIFYNSDIIVGLHGSGFANLPFCSPKTNILEIRSNSAGNVIQNIAKKSNLNYEVLIYKPQGFDPQNQQGKILVDINDLKKNIN